MQPAQVAFAGNADGHAHVAAGGDDEVGLIGRDVVLPAAAAGVGGLNLAIAGGAAVIRDPCGGDVEDVEAGEEDAFVWTGVGEGPRDAAGARGDAGADLRWDIGLSAVGVVDGGLNDLYVDGVGGGDEDGEDGEEV